MMSFIANICLNQIDDKNLKLRVILASPAVFALMLMYTVAKCPESFRYYLMPGSGKYSPEGIDSEFENEGYDSIKAAPKPRTPVVGALSHYVRQYWKILKVHRLRNTAITTGIVALSQQLSGINIMAFYGQTTLAVHTVFYSPGMGPVPFVLAAESFPLVFRDTGASLAISINLLFAGLLAWLKPLLVAGIRFGGTLGVFAGLNVVAFVLIFLLMEETSGVPLESLGYVFNQPKKDLIHFQLFEVLPWFGRFILGRSSLAERPERTVDLSPSSVPDASVTDDDEERIWNSDTVLNGVRLADMSGGNGRG
ncbi:myo-inositol transporter [Fusarium globosum]|uniref:Myo-inositol transporter n=1 Tax=Fusarium globosum TaxID=78864 RepID=A0A8H6D987_9HYPO|nr:myo-inositol transporter [Fusarium globosum]